MITNPIAHGIAQYGGRDQEKVEPEDVEFVGSKIGNLLDCWRRKDSSSHQKRITGQAKTDEQSRLGEDHQSHHHITEFDDILSVQNMTDRFKPLHVLPAFLMFTAIVQIQQNLLQSLALQQV